MTRSTPWADKVMAVIRSGNQAAALAQIKVAPSVRDLRTLQRAVQAQPALQSPSLAAAIDDNLALLAAPRLHRSP